MYIYIIYIWVYARALKYASVCRDYIYMPNIYTITDIYMHVNSYVYVCKHVCCM